MRKLKNKLRSRRGESLVESLIAILIIALTFTFLCSSIVTAAKINATIKDKTVEFSYDGQQNAYKGSAKDKLLHISAVRDPGSTSNDSTILSTEENIRNITCRPTANFYVDATGNFYHYEP